MSARCYICGIPCNVWSSDSRGCCSKCATDVFRSKFPGDTSSHPNGDGFPVGTEWDEHVRTAKLAWIQSHNAACKCCGANCKDWGISSYVNVCGGCYDKAYNMMYGHPVIGHNDGAGLPKISGWDSILLQIEKDMNSIKTKRVDEDTMKIETWDLIEGDRVQLRINDSGADDGFVEVEGTFLTRDNDGMAMIALDEEYHSDEYDSQSWYDQPIDGDKLRELARKYNVKHVDYDNVWTVEDDYNCETKITKVLKHQVAKDIKEMPKDMSTGREISWGQTFMKDSGKAAIRSGATLGIDGLKEGISKMLTSQGMNGPGVMAVLEFFNTDIGDAMLRAGLGYSLLGMPIPYIQDNEYAQQISEELRVSGLSGGMDEGVAMVKQFIVPSLLEAFKNTPIMQGIEASANKARVAESVAPQRVAAPLPQATEEMDLEEADPFATGKRAVA